MSKIEPSQALDRAIDLILHADHLTNNWTGRLITVQTSLVVAEGALLLWSEQTSPLIVSALVALIAVVAILSLWSLIHIIIREHDHGHWYIKMAKRAEGEDPFLFRDEDSEVSGTRFSNVLKGLRILLIIVWLVFSIVVIMALNCKSAG